VHEADDRRRFLGARRIVIRAPHRVGAVNIARLRLPLPLPFSAAGDYAGEMQPTVRSFDLAHLGHIELLTPRFDDSLNFFVNVMGMTESGRRGDSVYLRGWDDYEHHTLKLTASKVAGMGHFAFRATSPEALQRRAAVIEKAGFGSGWTDGDLGHGPTYAFTSVDGHRMEIYYETEWYTPPDSLKPSLKNQAMRFPARGMNVRRLDHLNLLASDVAALRRFMVDVVGLRTTEMIVLDNGKEAGAWVTSNNKTYDVAFTSDHYGAHGRFHHVTYAVDSREEVLRAADICLENGVFIETGPHKHAIQQTFFLYMYEPGGNRVEIDNAGARLMLAPDWQPIVWTEAERKKGQAWGLKTVESFHTYGTPPIEQYTGPRG
jgi:catechol 2,3-dioxygenase